MTISNHPANDIASTSNTYATYGLLITLYLAQGLPLGFITQALPAILREYEVSLQTIGWTGILLAPWALKFLWAPVVDRVYQQKIGQSRSWILPMQLLSALLLCVIAFMTPTELVNAESMRVLFMVLFFLNLCGASHDIASDALTTRTLENSSYSTGSSAQVIGYRMGLIFGGGVFLMIMDYLSWQTSFLLLSGFIVLNTIPILLHKEPNWQALDNSNHTNSAINSIINRKKEQSVSKKHTDAIVINKAVNNSLEKSIIKKDVSKLAWINEQFGYFWHNQEMRAWLLVLCTFKIADGLSSGMVKPMMTDMGISLKDIGLWGSVLGSAAALLGAGLAAILMKKLSRTTALIGFNFLQAVTTGFYAICAYYYEQSKQLSDWVIYFANAIEHVAAAMALVAMLSTVMYYARQKQAGSDFTFQVCMLAIISGNGHILSGYIAESLGYTGLFIISMLMGLLLLLPLSYWQSIFIKNRQ